MVEETCDLRGTVTRLFHSSPTFCAGKLFPVREDVTRAAEVNFAGKVFVREGEAVTLRGQWTDHPRFGRQFAAESRVHEAALDVAGLASWLAVNGDAAGIGPVKAEKIAREYGEQLPGVLRDDPEQVAVFAGLRLEAVKKLAASWAEHEEFNRVATRLAAYELTSHQIATLWETFRGSILPLLEHDPYALVGHVPGLGFRRVDEIAKQLGTPELHPGRLEAAALHCLQALADDGWTCVPRRHLIDGALEELDFRTANETVAVVAALDRMVADDRVTHLAADAWGVHALPGLYECESGVSDFLNSAGGLNPFWTHDLAELAADAHGPHLDPSQRRAVVSALARRGCLISGAAGTGKTTIVRVLHSAYAAADLSVALCAPTGKAARRLEQVVGREAYTVHRLLGFRYRRQERSGKFVGEWQYHAGNPLPHAAVVCDEVSMVDSELAYRLLSACGPRTSVVLVGDHHQLPPVGPGALLRDCIAHELLPLSVLAKCHRQAGALEKNCSELLSGNVPPTEPAAAPSPWYVVDNLHSADDVLRTVKRLFVELLPQWGFDPLRDAQFLTPQHKGPLGTRALNELLQRLYQRSLGVTVAPVDPDRKPPLYAGDKVIQTKNDYETNVMNGHQGVVCQLNPLVVDFDGKAVTVRKEKAKDIELAYALTVHKVQGSEFPCSIFVCHSKHSFMLHRNLVYTACTRAQKTCVVLGDARGVKAAAATVKANERRTLLGLLAREGADLPQGEEGR